MPAPGLCAAQFVGPAIHQALNAQAAQGKLLVMAPNEILHRRALNRATLARQLLLRRADSL
ncbi:MAG: hypothetical protein ABIQ18_31760 [Umezawaea sp.]